MLATLLAVAALLGASLAFPASGAEGATAAPALRVEGNQLIDEKNEPHRLLGVNRSGGEYACVQGWGIWDGPVDDASLAAIADWNTNTVRVPLNEECWLGLDNIDPQYGGENYISEIEGLVGRLQEQGLTPVLDLHWSHGQYTGGDAHCPDTAEATCQKPMPNAEHTPEFWASVAETFADRPAVLFDLFNEPFPDRATDDLDAAWTCWRDGGDCPGIDYEVAGMQDLVDAIRATGAENTILAAGLAYANDMRGWLEHRPEDPTGNLAASWHTYNFNTCADTACFEEQLTPVIAQVPLVAGEIGENTCAHGYVDEVMNWLDGQGASYLGWTWNTWDCATGPALISDFDGTPTPYGEGLRNHLQNMEDTQ